MRVPLDRRRRAGRPLIAVRQTVAVLAICLRVDARRPASWIAAAAAAAAVVMLARAAPPSGMTDTAAGVCGGLLAAASLGSLAGGGGCGEAERWTTRVLGRLAWPVAGTAAACVWLLATGVAPRETLRITVLVAGAAVMAVMVFRLVAWRRPGAGARERHDVRHAGAAFSAAVGHGPPAVRSWPEALAMATTLVAMAVCYFLAPEFAAWYAGVAVAWFVVLGVPVATTASGDADALARRDLVRTCVGRPRLPGTTAHALAAILTHAAILGWPAVVAAVLWRGAAWTSGGPILAILVVASLATATAVVVWGADACNATRDTAAAVIVALLVAVVSGLATAAAGGRPVAGSPSLRTLPSPPVNIRC